MNAGTLAKSITNANATEAASFGIAAPATRSWGAVAESKVSRGMNGRRPVVGGGDAGRGGGSTLGNARTQRNTARAEFYPACSYEPANGCWLRGSSGRAADVSRRPVLAQAPVDDVAQQPVVGPFQMGDFGDECPYSGCHG